MTKHVLPLLILNLLLTAGCRQNTITAPILSVSGDSLKSQIQLVLTQAANSDDPASRCHVLETCAAWPAPQAVTLIQKGFSDPVPAVRFAAAMACGDRQTVTLRNQLNPLLNDPDPSVRLAAAFALEKMGDKRFQHTFDPALFGDDPQLSGQTCIILGRLGNTPLRADSKEKLWRVLHDKNKSPAVRLQAAEALARLKDRTIIKKLFVYAGSGYADDRMIAISGLEQLGGNDANAMLVTLVEDQQIEVQLAAIAAIGRLAEPRNRQLAQKYLDYQDPSADAQTTMRIRGLAALALGKIGDKNDASLLARAMHDPNIYVRLAAARATLDWLKINSQSPSGN